MQQPNGNEAASIESPERLARPLIRLAKACGVSTSYVDQMGAPVEIRDDVLVGVLAALDVDASTPESVERALADVARQRRDRIVSPTLLAITDRPNIVTINRPADDITQVSITLEDGRSWPDELHAVPAADSPATATLTLPTDLPIGYHTLTVLTHTADAQPSTAQDSAAQAVATLIVAPPRIELPPSLQADRRSNSHNSNDRRSTHPWGWMTQLYSVRSAGSWGVGDYGDLRRLLADAAAHSTADFMLINPIHACAPVPPLQPSPYLPESRRFLNVTYIRPQDIPEYAALPADRRAAVDRLHATLAAANDSAQPLDINAAWSAKRQALRIIFDQPRTAAREAAFAAFKQAAGSDLDAFATWCVAFETWGAPWERPSWFDGESKSSPRVARLVREHADDLEFARWMQWIADEQVAAAHQAALDGGMALGLMQDMAVGVHALGADVWWSPERFAKGATVGAPPDFYNQQGQDWGQPPFSPRYLEDTGYRVYREMLHGMFAHAGALRIDHVLGLFRLWWIPAGHGAADGAYVTYDHEVMLAILAIEATRAHGVVIGEDLGTVPPYVSRVLAEHGVLGTVVEWFTREGDSPNAGDPYALPSTYRRAALASVTTHDLPPTAGYLALEHVRLREELGLLTEPAERFRAAAVAERRSMIAMLARGSWLDRRIADACMGGDAGTDGHAVDGHAASDHVAADNVTADNVTNETAAVAANEQAIIEAMHAALLSAPSVLLQATIADAVGERRVQNQPGTSDEYPNWRIPLCDGSGRVVHTDEVFSLPRVQSLCHVMACN
ncbi:4-alpha-glucanotransferase [Bifidobacterium leontopitheci]|uniref:4-alpha-glucanotransferase n=1 Tax=Bifidobacterium leontopitheci TaxID=2650774 RepID=A0A6I1GDM7_9BIFI|nr:4-alpha-glucanotransferase [Bifidobacterium leontopitheci]KAB7789635.1 4-alpha-glucanotransferase [Bifidobacterium leontopitheci]